ncbi:hypothetical protein CABS03_14092 [Colletotrichum abscissum]|uniref:Uncharacterized protein n=1 Tax=Colletotrichum abscissum TaxID=1671311 RepID=A0A9P9XEZ5_9PEZI|nr:hypothetical protein CABS02_07453 [Colletotrichum abscissum]
MPPWIGHVDIYGHHRRLVDPLGLERGSSSRLNLVIPTAPLNALAGKADSELSLFPEDLRMPSLNSKSQVPTYLLPPEARRFRPLIRFDTESILCTKRLQHRISKRVVFPPPCTDLSLALSYQTILCLRDMSIDHSNAHI